MQVQEATYNIRKDYKSVAFEASADAKKIIEAFIQGKQAELLDQLDRRVRFLSEKLIDVNVMGTLAEKINQYEARQWEKDELLSGCVNSLLSLTEWGKEEKTARIEQCREIQTQMEEQKREHDKQYTEMEKKLEKRLEKHVKVQATNHSELNQKINGQEQILLLQAKELKEMKAEQEQMKEQMKQTIQTLLPQPSEG